MSKKHRTLLCTACGRKLRVRDGELVPCDHSSEDVRVDWTEFKAARIEESWTA